MFHIRIKVTSPSKGSINRVAVQQRLERGFSDASEPLLYDLPQTREEVLTVSKIVGKDGVVLLGSERNGNCVQSLSL